MTTRRIFSLVLSLLLSLALVGTTFADTLEVDNASMFRIPDSAVTVTADAVSPSAHYTNVVNVGLTQTYNCPAPVTVTRGSNPELTDFFVCELAPGGNSSMPYEYGENLAVKDNSVTITEPGLYLAYGSFWSYPVKNVVVLNVTESAGDQELAAPAEPETPSSTAPAALKSFSDVAANHWAHDAIMEMVERGMFKGTKEPDSSGVGEFNPKGTMSRAEFITVLVRHLYADDLAAQSEGSKWYSSTYAAAINNSLFTTIEFPFGMLESSITREEMALLAVRAAETQGETLAGADESAVADYDTIGENYRTCVLQAYSAGLLTGYDSGDFGPKDTLTREQGAMVAYRLLNKDARVK